MQCISVSDLDERPLPTELSHYLVGCVNKGLCKSSSIESRNGQSSTCEVVHETKLTSEISFPTDSSLAQLVEYGTDDLEVVNSNPTGGNF